MRLKAELMRVRLYDHLYLVTDDELWKIRVTCHNDEDCKGWQFEANINKQPQHKTSQSSPLTFLSCFILYGSHLAVFMLSGSGRYFSLWILTMALTTSMAHFSFLRGSNLVCCIFWKRTPIKTKCTCAKSMSVKEKRSVSGHPQFYHCQLGNTAETAAVLS